MSYEEMLPSDVFERPRGWQTKVRIKHLLTKEDSLTPEQINERAKQVATALKNCKLFDDNEFIENLECVDDLDEFNFLLDDMYTYCNLVRIWVE